MSSTTERIAARDKNGATIEVGSVVSHEMRGWVAALVLEINQWSTWAGHHCDLVVDLPAGREAVLAGDRTEEGFIFDRLVLAEAHHRSDA